jgi:hypothetical protein
VAMAQVMSGMPDVWRRVLAEHVPDQGGRCQACRDEGGFSASWPCLTRQIAEQAKRIHDGPPPDFPPLQPAEWHTDPTALREPTGPSSAEWQTESTPSPGEQWRSDLTPGDLTPGGFSSGSHASNDFAPDPPPRRAPLRAVQQHTEVTPPRPTGRHAAP